MMLNNEPEIAMRSTAVDVWAAYHRTSKIIQIVGHVPEISALVSPGQIIMAVSILFPTTEALPAETSTLISVKVITALARLRGFRFDRSISTEKIVGSKDPLGLHQALNKRFKSASAFA